ncbi:L-rhamnose mutarotase [Curtobacterium sp. PhB130]|uniref:L-rhamnose mutarotase n=1 Tax=unclassified Curtobacterium TaxID=257496 RepID=UPI000F4C6E6C|nr:MULTISPECIES: L-rhamnose mutarotase [unclassified Curtobacterium]ROS77319.1 L-rhamnose mutarotase [Curtobacterium sp. PhB130]TCK66476.1 L-rhamnose mutarotase [Curtobacterium sp. PhB136]
MQRILSRTRLRAGREGAYEQAHAAIPPELVARLRGAGVTNWSIWRDGQDLIHLIEVTDYRAMRRSLADDPVNAAWQEVINPLLEADDDYSGNDDGVPLVWTLSEQTS